jgi:hypothetical protein
MRTLAIGLVLVLFAGCGGGGGAGGGGNNITPLLAATRYFPSPIGARYSYHIVALDTPLTGDASSEPTYIVQTNPLGPGVYYNLDDSIGQEHGPVFDGLIFRGLARENTGITLPDFTIVAGTAPEVLPANLSHLGQTWSSSFSVQRPGGQAFDIAGTSVAMALQTVTTGGQTFNNCLRVDVQFSYVNHNLNIPVATGSYWLAPDVGPVLGTMQILGAEVGRVRLAEFIAP